MPKKIDRNIALIKFRTLPLQEYDKETDTDVFYYPKAVSFHWVKLKKVTKKKLTLEFKKLIQKLEINELIILGQINKPWISNYTRKRKDYKSLTKTIDYFDSLKMNKKFNGAIQISIDEIEEFTPYFYTITACDGGFSDYYITDINENILFHIHYSGEIKILTLNDETKKKLKSIISETNFIDSLMEGTDRIK